MDLFSFLILGLRLFGLKAELICQEAHTLCGEGSLIIYYSTVCIGSYTFIESSERKLSLVHFLRNNGVS